MSDDLDTLVTAARAGGGWAFGRLWESLAPSVAGYLRGRGIADADDVTSEVFLAAFQGLGRFDGDGAAFKAWLFTIAHHKAVDAVRRSARALPTVSYEPHDDERAAASAEAEVLARLARRDVEELLAGLSADQREVLLLRVLGDLTVEQVARATGRTPGAVKQLQRRAVAQLRKRVGAPGQQESSDDPVPLRVLPAITESR